MLSHKFDFWRRWNTIASCIVVCLLLCVSTWCGFQGVFGCGLVVLRFRQALAVVLRSCSCASIPFFPRFLLCRLYLPVSSVLLSSRALGPHLLCAVVLYFCHHAIYSPTGLWFCVVLFPWDFGWSLRVL